MVDEVERRTFDFFWELGNSRNGLVPDRAPTPSFSSIAAVGFGLTAYPIGVERGWVTREAARERVLTTLRFFSSPRGAAGAHGFSTTSSTWRRAPGSRTSSSRRSTRRSCSRARSSASRTSTGPIRARRRSGRSADGIYRAADWSFWLRHPPLVSMGWTPEGGFNDWDWHGLNEGMILYVLALGSPTHPIPAEAWERYTSTYKWRKFYGQEYVQFAPLFGHQYSHVWIDFRGIRDAYMRGKGIDYFENSRRATYAHRAYADRQPGRMAGVWSECVGPFRVRRPDRRRLRDRRPQAALLHVRGARRFRGRDPRRRDDRPDGGRELASLRTRDRPPGDRRNAFPRRRPGLLPLRVPGRVQPDVPSRRSRAPRRGRRRGGLVRPRLPRHRPGARSSR